MDVTPERPTLGRSVAGQSRDGAVTRSLALIGLGPLSIGKDVKPGASHGSGSTIDPTEPKANKEVATLKNEMGKASGAPNMGSDGSEDTRTSPIRTPSYQSEAGA